MTENKYFKLFENCFPIKGYSRSIIYDSQCYTYDLIPNSLYEIINKFNNKQISEFNKTFSVEEIEIIKTYFDFLEGKAYSHLINKNELKFYPKLNLNWEYPFHISNSIIDIDSNKIDIFNIISQINLLDCPYIQLRFFYIPKYEYIIEMLKLLCGTSFLTVELLIDNKFFNSIEQALKLIDSCPKKLIIKCFNAKSDSSFKSEKGIGKLVQFRRGLLSPRDCGKIDAHYFVPWVNHFLESQHYNTCLNRKLCIDNVGNIKNCPTMERCFGNVKDITLEEAMQKEGFKDLWSIRKDEIDVCKDCEFRYMCTDCRCFIKVKEDIYSQPAKCGYNPYIAKWDGDEGYITVEQWRIANPNWEKKAKRKPLVKKPQPVE